MNNANAAPEFVEISEQDFDQKYRPQLAPSGDLLTYEQVKDAPLNRVWTIVEGDEPCSEDDVENDEPLSAGWYAMPGFHLVNRLGYVLTEQPWDHENMQAVYFAPGD